MRASPTRPAPASAPPVPWAAAQILALQATAGNRAVCTRVLAREPISNHVERHPAPGPLDLAREDEAVESANRRLDAMSIRAVQWIVGTPATGTIAPEDVQAIARLAPSRRSGVLKGPVLDALVLEAARIGMHDEAIHVVASLFKLDIAAALSVRFDPNMGGAHSNTGFEGTLRFITIGPNAFASAKTLRDAIDAMLHEPNPQPPPQPRPFVNKTPSRLTSDEADRAVEFNRTKLRDPRAIQAVQRDVLARINGVHDFETAQYIADAQHRMRMVPTGRIDREMFDAVFLHRSTVGEGNAAIRLAVDYFRLENDAVLDVFFDPGLTEICELHSLGKGAPAMLTFGAPLFDGGVDSAVREIASFYEQARARMQGGGVAAAREFLGAAEAALNRRLGPQEFFSFTWTARDAVDAFEKLAPKDQLAMWSRFEQLRGEYRDRFRAAPANDRRQVQWVFEKLEAVARPRP